jgi:hypothetical protein
MKTSPKDFFLHVGAIATLYFGIFNFLTLMFRIIDVKFPDQLERYFDPYSSDLRFAIASLLIITPVHLILMWLLNREYTAMPEKRDLSIRKWLVNLTLFAAGLAIVGSLIALVNSFLGGELTTRFLLKAATILVVAAGVFWYYIADLRRASALSATGMRTLIIALVIVVIATIGGGFAVMGSPMKMRQYRFDSQRVSDLQNLQYQILNYWQTKQKLPASLDELRDPLSGNVVPTDPATGKGYEYQTTGNLNFKLCADFNLTSDDVKGTPYSYGGGITRPMMDYGPVGPEQENWQHQAGKACFDRTIDPDRYPPINKLSR